MYSLKKPVDNSVASCSKMLSTINGKQLFSFAKPFIFTKHNSHTKNLNTIIIPHKHNCSSKTPRPSDRCIRSFLWNAPAKFASVQMARKHQWLYCYNLISQAPNLNFHWYLIRSFMLRCHGVHWSVSNMAYYLVEITEFGKTRAMILVT